MKTVRFGWMQVLAGIGLLMASIASTRAAEGLVREVTFKIEAQALDTALLEFSRQADIQLMLASSVVKKRHSNGLSGRLSVEEGLSQLLRGTGLKFRAVGNRVTIESLDEVSGELAAGHTDTLAQASSPSPQAEVQTETKNLDPSARKDKSHVQEITVTATKRAERAQDIPLSIAVISSQDIDRRGLIGMEDYLRSIPGVNQLDNGPQSNAIVIRGITTTPQSENYNSGTTVATYFDETPITGAAGMGAGGIDVRPVDIARIEVLRGPQGTTYGSASLGGTLRIMPAKPELNVFSTRLAASYSDTGGNGSENSMIQGVLNIPVISDKLALRAVGYRYDESGFYRNIAGIDPVTIARAESRGLGDFVRGYTLDNVGRMLSTGGRIAALWQMTDKAKLSVNFLTQKIEQTGDPVATTAGFAQARMPVAQQDRVRGEAGEISDAQIDLANMVFDYDFGWAALTSVVSKVDSGSVYARDLSTSFGFPISSFTPSNFESSTAEMRLASQLDGRFQFLGGIYYEDVDDDFLQTLDWPGVPAPTPVYGTNPGSINNRERTLRQRAIFGEVSYDLTDKVTATFGGRYFEYDKHERALLEGGSVPVGSGVNQFLENSDSGSIFKASVGYKPVQDSLIYASWSEGFRLGRPNVRVSSLLCDTNGDGLVDGTGSSVESTGTIESDFLENYEVGAKFALFDRRVTIDTSIYHILWEGLPIRYTAPIPGGCTFIANVGKAKSDGVEVQGSLLVARGLRLDFGVGYTKAVLTEDAPALFVRAGARLPGSPRTTANLAAQYDFDVGGHQMFLRADSFYAGEFYGDLLETPNLRAGGYVKIDARIGVAINRNLSADLFVRNLTDEDAFTWRNTFNQGEFYGFRMRPRTVGVQLGYSFR